jgi:hypothetical protein
MSIGAIGGLTAAATAINALATPEPTQAQRAPQDDADSYNGVPAAAHAFASADADVGSGRVDVKA